MTEPERTGSTPIRVFQRDASLANLVVRCDLPDQDFLARYPDPVLLTSMPADVSLSAWVVALPIRRRRPASDAEIELSKTAKALLQEAESRGERFCVGRSPECDVVLAPRTVSRRHAAFEREGSAWSVSDLRSSNGTRVSEELLRPGMRRALGNEPVKITFGSDATLWYMSPAVLLAYIRGLRRQASDTSKTKLPLPPSKKETVARVDVEKLRRAEAETGALTISTWHDEPRAALPTVADVRLPPLDPSHKLVAAVRAIAALDLLILTVSARLRNDQRLISLYSAESTASLAEVADQIMRMGPLLKTVLVSLSVGDGIPVEIYSDPAD